MGQGGSIVRVLSGSLAVMRQCVFETRTSGDDFLACSVGTLCL